MNDEAHKNYLLSNNLYDILKLLALLIFPAIGTLYLTLSGIWGLPYTEEVLSTIVAVDTFLGVIIKIGDSSYNNSNGRYDGEIDVFENADRTSYVLSLEGNPENIKNMREAIFKVKPNK